MLVVVAVFLADIALKIVSRAAPTIVGRFSYTSAIGDFGIVPSTNNVLAFSLPIPNAYIWPLGWLVVFALIGLFLQSTKHQAPNSKQIPSTNIQNVRTRHLGIRYWKLFGIWNLEFGISRRDVAITAIILGAISNLIDRTFFGGVTDYLSFSDLYPAFNIADLLIIMGLVWLVLARRSNVFGRVCEVDGKTKGVDR